MNTWCTIFGHKMITVDGDNVAGPLKCARDNCDHTAARVEWPTYDGRDGNGYQPITNDLDDSNPPQEYSESIDPAKNTTNSQKKTAFEWLRKTSLDGSDDSDSAAIMMYEIDRLMKLAHPEYELPRAGHSWEPESPPPIIDHNHVVEWYKTNIPQVKSIDPNDEWFNAFSFTIDEYHIKVFQGVEFIGVINIPTVNQPQWQPVDQHDTIGWCWIKYKGRVRHAWHKGDRWFMFNEHGMTGCYLTECISGVIAIEVPKL